MIKITDTFDIRMLKTSWASIMFKEIDKEYARKILLGGQSYIDSTDTAVAISSDLGIKVPCNQEFAKLEPGDTMIVCQLQGGPLPEGITTLPKGFSFTYWMVFIQ